MGKWTLAVPYNDLAAAEKLFAERGSEIACLIIEPVMMNIGIVLPRPGYLEGCASCAPGTGSSSSSTR